MNYGNLVCRSKRPFSRSLYRKCRPFLLMTRTDLSSKRVQLISSRAHFRRRETWYRTKHVHFRGQTNSHKLASFRSSVTFAKATTKWLCFRKLTPGVNTTSSHLKPRYVNSLTTFSHMFILGFLHLLFLFLSVCNFVAKTTKYLTVKGFWFQLVFLASVFGDVNTYWLQWYQKNFFQCSSRPFSGMTRTSLSTCTYSVLDPGYAYFRRRRTWHRTKHVHFRGQPKSRNLGFRSNVHFHGADVVFRSSIFEDNSDEFVSLWVLLIQF